MRVSCVHAGQDREQGGLAYHGQADNCSFHIWIDFYRGTSTRLRISSMMRSPASPRALRQRRARVHHHAMREHRHHQPLHVVRNRVVAAFHSASACAARIQRLRAARTHAQRQRFVRARPLHDRQHVIHQRLVHRHALHRVLQLEQFLARQHRLHRSRRDARPDCAGSRARSPRPDSRCAGASGTGRAAIPAADRCRDAPPDSASRSP